MIEIIWTSPALTELEAIQDYIAAENPSAAYRVALHIQEAVENLKTFPKMGRPGRVKHTRELILSDIPYIVPYKIAPRAIYILSVFHASRKWPDDFLDGA